MELKICTKCKEEKNINEFHKRTQSKDGYHFNCKKCIKEGQKDYYSNNKERQKELSNKFKFNNPTYLKTYYQNNKKILNNKINLYNKEKRKTDPLFKLKGNIRCLINSNFKYKGFKKNTKNEIILGCNKIFLYSYLESKFESWMSWENYGKYNGKPNFGWDIDHIIPLSSAKTEEEFLKLNYYTNLQPLCSYTNRDIKRDKLNYGY